MTTDEQARQEVVIDRIVIHDAAVSPATVRRELQVALSRRGVERSAAIAAEVADRIDAELRNAPSRAVTSGVGTDD